MAKTLAQIEVELTFTTALAKGTAAQLRGAINLVTGPIGQDGPGWRAA